MRTTFACLIALFTFLPRLSSLAQSPEISYKSVNISSPTAASLGKFVDQPVNYGQGLPEIGYPIYTIQEGPLSLPISLSYHAQGIKVMEPASWVGANWALNAGGVITRSVRGAPDEKLTNDAINNNHGYYSDYGISGVAMYDYQYPGMTHTWGWDWENIQRGGKDGEPDFYTFSMPGYSGKFCFSDDRTPMFFPDQDIKIEVNYTGTGSFQSFILTVPDGTRYYFGRTASTTDVDPVEITKVSSEANNTTLGNIVSSWFLNKIESADRLFTINLNYVQERYSYMMLSLRPLSWENNGDKEYNLAKSTVLGVRLQSITFSNGRVDFNAGALREDLLGFSTYQLIEDANTEARPLSSISIYKPDNSLLKSYNFTTSYTIDNTSGLNGAIQGMYPSLVNDKKKLRLNSVTESNSLGQTLPPTTYDYFTEPVTRRLSFGQDHWGYANGVGNNGTLIATYTENTYTINAGANRDPVWPQMRGGALKRINHPTGGYTDYDFEANTVWVTKSVLSDVFAFSKQVSYTSSQTSPGTTTSNLIQGQHKVTLISSGGTDNAYATVRLVSSGSIVAAIVAAPGQTSSATFTVPSNGNYSLEVLKPFTSSGNGATGTIYSQQYVDQSENMMAGGLRIKTITQVDNGPSPDVVTNFDYNYNNKSTAALYGKPYYVDVLRNDRIKERGYNILTEWQNICSLNGCFSCDNVQNIRVAFYKAPGNLRLMDNLQGSHIGYTEVKVSQPTNGSSIYRYYGPQPAQMIYNDVVGRNVNSTFCDANTPNYPQAPLPFDYKRGELKTELHFNQSGQLLKQIDNNTLYDTVLNVFAPGNIQQTFLFGPGSQYGAQVLNQNWTYVTGTYYELGTKKKRYTAVFTRELVPNIGYIDKIDTVFYTSRFHGKENGSVSINSEGKRSERKIRYANDYRSSSCDNISDCNASYTTAMGNCLNTKIAAQAACTTGDELTKSKCRLEALFNCDKCQQDVRASWAATCRKNYLNPALSSSYPYCEATARNNATGDLKPVLHLRDIYNNPPVEVTEWNDGKLTKARYVSFYKEDVSGQIITPDKEFTIPTATSLTNFSASAVSGTNITKDARYVQEVDVNLSQGVLREVVKKDGVPQAYLWDATKSFPVAVATGAMEANIAYSSFEDGAKGSFVYNGTPTFVSTAPFPPTGKYYLVLNGTSSVLSRAVVNGASYTLSYWRNSATAFAITGGTVQDTKTGPTINGWTFFEHKVLATSTSLSINQSGNIDEVRLYYLGALMKTYTYNKLVGITSETDERGTIKYYEYDAFNRLLHLKDMRGNVLKLMEYQLNQSY